MRNSPVLKICESPEAQKLAEKEKIRQHILRAEKKVEMIDFCQKKKGNITEN